jgi:cell wall-associated NlpC family hydrolase
VTGRTATGGPVWYRTSGRSITGWAPIVVFLAALAAGLLLAVSSASADTITSKQAQAQEVMSQVQQLYSDEERATEAWNYAGEQLQQIDGELATNGKNLVAAKKSLKHAQGAIATRLRQLYVQGEGDSTLEVLLGSSSLEDVVTRLDALQRVSHQDAKILTDVKKYKKEVLDRRAQLQDARTKQVDLVAERAAQKQAIEGKIAEQNQLLASIKGQIAQMKIEEQRREAALAAQARARLAAEQAAAQQAAAQQSALATPVATDIPDAPPPDGTLSTQVVSIAMQYLGIPYVWGGASPSTGFDCSGFVMYVFAQVGVYLPHHAASQYGYGTAVSQDQLAPGDLVFFDGLGHVGIYIGGGQFIHAPHTGDVVKISSLYEDWYSSTYVGARRVL